MDERKVLTDDELEGVVGGLFNWNPSAGKMVYTHADGTKTTYTILNYNEAWAYSNRCHGANKTEDYIVAGLISRGLIK